MAEREQPDTEVQVMRAPPDAIRNPTTEEIGDRKGRK